MKAALGANVAYAETNLIDGFSLEMTARDVDSLNAAASNIAAGTPVAITFLPGESYDARVAVVRAVRKLGFEPMPHFSARLLQSVGEFECYLHRICEAANVTRCFVIAGDTAKVEGPFPDSMSLIASGAFERYGASVLGIAGHPEGHPHMTDEQCWQTLETKCAEIGRRGMAPLIVTQFAFDADRTLRWLETLRSRGIVAPVRIGVPGPAGIKTLMRFAARCGVGASTTVLAKYGISIGRLIGSAGPDRLLDTFARSLGPQHGLVRLHFYPFGGLEKTVAWIRDYDSAH
ncbi:methylenetetrahydrofolate reductase [Novosphingobium endophyticum]|uniref:Methylenetetrahydrofolate reductase n=1 Tax=Novosphingobium endophyticum TaxID=1955250 RepID=A0A916X3P3_9SPHN|nr:methylenetetrahydrofolate reductase [Novosphingobium endophyticum]GGB94856.1 methylenetetrahydrofolate reductase [Novosphingobium endophyticum]